MRNLLSNPENRTGEYDAEKARDSSRNDGYKQLLSSG